MEKVGWAGERGRRKGVERDERRSMVGTPKKKYFIYNISMR